jgi:tRNA (mo5U34)-methyltransferase
VFGLDGRIILEKRQVYDLAAVPDRYDLILFMGVFYHLRYPLLALDILARLKPRQLVFQSLTTADAAELQGPMDVASLDDRARLDVAGWPKLAFVEGSLLGDPTNWWIPNVSACRALLRSAGFRIAATPGHEIFVCEPNPDHREDPLAASQFAAALAAGDGD